MSRLRTIGAAALLAAPAAAAAADVALPRAFIGTWASRRQHCDLDGVYALQANRWIEGETWTCELTGIERSTSRMTLKGACVLEQTSERAERTLALRIEAGRLTHIEGLRVIRCR